MNIWLKHFSSAVIGIRTHNMETSYLRKQLFSGIDEHTGEKHNDSWLVSNWPVYIEEKYERPDPEPDILVAELKDMVNKMQTPHCEYGMEGGQVNLIPARKLNDLELLKLRELLPIYEQKLCTKWQEQNANQIGRKNADIIIAQTQHAMDLTIKEMNKVHQWHTTHDEKIQELLKMLNIHNTSNYLTT